MKIGIAADHRGFDLKERLKIALTEIDLEVTDYGAFELDSTDDYSDFVAPMARAVGQGSIEKGIAICGSGIGASIAANKVRNVRAGLIHDLFSAQQGVEDDHMNVMCLGAQIDHFPFAWQLTQTFLRSRFKNEVRFQRRLQKLALLERSELPL
ncbi:MAG: RpiB/LacA/LacB family sugar-phosphate isomerase [Chitinophagaceae bacterium]|nr:RpiB/LacA/LacB family sugar-phosphate isomerase [Oligoflexus sp.]